MSAPPEHVLSAFPAPAGAEKSSEKLGYAWDYGWRIGDIVYSRTTELNSWSAKVREKLTVEGARIARPVLSTDGRYTVGGWKASQYIVGSLARRVDETVLLALRLDEAMAGLSAPYTGTAESRQDIFAQAERMAWAETGEGYRELDTASPKVVGHADLLATTVYSGTNPPAILDIVPTDAPRPRGYTAALVAVDGLIAGAVDDGICGRFAHIPEFDQLLMRAVAYRRHVNNLHPESLANTRSHIERVESLLMSRQGAIM